MRIFFEELLKSATDIRKLAHLKVAAIGKGTKKALEEKGFFADYMPEVFDGEALGRGLCEICEGTEKILLPRAKMCNQEILAELAKKPGILVDDISIYDTFYETRDLLGMETYMAREASIDSLLTLVIQLKGKTARK